MMPRLLNFLITWLLPIKIQLYYQCNILLILKVKAHLFYLILKVEAIGTSPYPHWHVDFTG